MTAVTSAAALTPRNARTSIKTLTTGASNYMIVDVVMSSSYATGGDTIDFGSAIGAIGGTSGTNQPKAVFCQAIGPTAAGYLATYDLTNKKLMLFRQSAATSALTEPNGVDTHTTTVRCLVFF
jgi:hypothetical protein